MIQRVEEIERQLRVAEDELSYVQKKRQFLLDQIASLKREKEILLHSTIEERHPEYSDGIVTNQSSEEAKIALFRSLFRGREDVYARRFESRTTGKRGYQPDCENEWRPGICQKPKDEMQPLRSTSLYSLIRRCNLAQYAGRPNRVREGKQQATIYDYADLEVPMLKRMFERRRRGHRQLGYEICSEQPVATDEADSK